MEIPDGLVAVGRLHSPHGLSGQIKAECLSWNPNRFRGLSEVVLVNGRTRRETKIVDAMAAGPLWRLSFEGIRDPESAKLLSGAWICVPEASVQRPPGGWIEADLENLPVVDALGAVLGRALGLADIPTFALRVVAEDGTEIVLPLEGPLACRVDMASRRVVADREIWDALS
ncbi:MAG TPA: hypothetical protein VN931_01295 [Fibrobacteria bacterium]|nr:hypothetical protein [Fibrobacteria bacterium]